MHLTTHGFYAMPVSYTHLEGKAAGKGGRAMKAAILFPEVCNLYGDLQNIYYLKRCCPALEIIEKSYSFFLPQNHLLSVHRFHD